MNCAKYMSDRNWEIYRRRVEDKQTFKSIGQKYGISATRVRQIVYKGERLIARHMEGEADAGKYITVMDRIKRENV
jgi:DNA-directed RNA polymerase sigma subunit (sigma70/sigma32)